MNDHYPPPVRLPKELSDEAAAKLLDFLHDLADAFENYYAGQLHRYYHATDERQASFWEDTGDPPF